MNTSLKVQAKGSAAATAANPANYDDQTVLARVAALKSMSTPELKRRWAELFDTPPPPYSRAVLEGRLAYRVQELAFGGLTSQTVDRLRILGEELDGSRKEVRRIRGSDRPIVGTRLVREWQGVEYTVTVTADGYEWQGRPYQSLSSAARAITGTRWNGPLFFGLRNHRAGAKGRGR